MRSEEVDSIAASVATDGVTVDSGKNYGMIGDSPRERIVCWKFLVGPEVLIPSATLDPLSRLRGLGAVYNPGDHFVVGLGTSELNVAERRAKSKQMRVRIDHSRNDSASMRIDDASPGAR